MVKRTRLRPGGGGIGDRAGRSFNERYNGGDARASSSDTQTGTSIFDPVLCEIAYRWFCPAGAHILDPFAGGSVRGIVAVLLGYYYIGIDLSQRQIESNREQAEQICGANKPEWIVGDGLNVKKLTNNAKFDFIFSCPPYHDLEVYSENKNDLSNMDWGTFLNVYRNIISSSVDLLKENRFACFVVANIRDKNGMYKDLVSSTIRAFKRAGMGLYNDAILINAIGSLPVRVGRQFAAGRKLGKTHQNVLIFYKGDIKRIKEEFSTLKEIEEVY